MPQAASRQLIAQAVMETSLTLSKTIPAAPARIGQPALRVGFVPLTDCAPLVMAHELGLFRKYGLRVVLSREIGWATVRDKLVHGELDAAHALAALPVVTTLGLGCVRCDCCTALVLNLHGNAITLSNELWRRGVRDGATLREEVKRSRRERTLTFGVVFPFSSHHFLLRKWLAEAGIDPARDVRIVVVPPPQMPANLKSGNLDGFCVGEPWNSVAVQARAGWCAVTSAELAPDHPEKVLMVRRSFDEERDEEHLALVAAIREACAFCDAPENRERIARTLAKPAFVGVAAATLLQGFGAQFDFGHGQVRDIENFNVFHRANANDPTGDKAAWVFENIRTSGLCQEPAALDFQLSQRVFRQDIYRRATLRQAPVQTKPQDESNDENQFTFATCHR